MSRVHVLDFHQDCSLYVIGQSVQFDQWSPMVILDAKAVRRSEVPVLADQVTTVEAARLL